MDRKTARLGVRLCEEICGRNSVEAQKIDQIWDIFRHELSGVGRKQPLTKAPDPITFKDIWPKEQDNGRETS